jgi:integrase
LDSALSFVMAQYPLASLDLLFGGEHSLKKYPGTQSAHRGCPKEAHGEPLLNRARFRAKHCPDSDWVFAHRNGRRIRFMQNGFQAACKRAKIADFRVHDLRHTFASSLVQGGVPSLEVAKLLGHSTIEMTERYAHVSPENLKAAVGVLDRLRSGYVDRADAVVALKVSA